MQNQSALIQTPLQVQQLLSCQCNVHDDEFTLCLHDNTLTELLGGLPQALLSLLHNPLVVLSHFCLSFLPVVITILRYKCGGLL